MAGKAAHYRDSVSIEMKLDTDEAGGRVIKAAITGDRKLFDTVVLLEERGGVMPLEERIRRVIEKEVVESLREVDKFFKLVRSAKPKMRVKRSKPGAEKV